MLTAVGMTACEKPAPDQPAVEGYKVGDYYKSGLVEGIVYKLNNEEGTSGMIFSLEEWSAKWSTESVYREAMSPDNGLYNWNLISAVQGWETLYPAFGCCNELNGGFITGWHLPSQYDVEYISEMVNHCSGELFEKVNSTIVEHGGVQLSATDYWTSSEAGPTISYSINLTTGTFDEYRMDKSLELKVRAVKHF